MRSSGTPSGWFFATRSRSRRDDDPLRISDTRIEMPDRYEPGTGGSAENYR
jgi:hypothetical protein